MTWEILWPLILGFALSGAVQAVYRTLQLPGELELLPPLAERRLPIAAHRRRRLR